MVDLDGLLEQPVEEQAAMVGAAAVEAERELVEVVVELPAVTEASARQPAQRRFRPLFIRQKRCPPHAGQAKPPGQRSPAR
jgi:hypothetical protein